MGCAKSKVAVIEPSESPGTQLSEQPRPSKPSQVSPVKPTRNKKKDAVPQPSSFSAIDEHALKAPVSARSSVSALVQYLVKPARNDMDRVRLFYRWITDNISYDTDGFFNASSGPQDCDSVLKRGTSVCAGYANVFESLCSEAGIPCKVISGFSKAFGYNPENPFTLNTRTDHAWNIVYVNGEWRPLESTWGAGHISTSKTFEKCFEEVYFLTDPEDFVYKHFPYIDKNLEASLPLQLLKKPLSLEQFSSALCPQTKGIEWGFQCSSHKTGVIDVNKETDIKFTTRNVDLEDILCNLTERNTNEKHNKYVLLRKNGNNFTIKVRPPVMGEYDLELFGKPVNSQGKTHNSLIAFVIRCSRVQKNIRPYPEKGGTWGGKYKATQYGFTKDIFRTDYVTTTKGEVIIKIKTERKPAVSLELSHAELERPDLERYVSNHYEGNTLVIEARLSASGFYNLSLFAKHPEREETNSFDSVANFIIESQKDSSEVQPFPMSYSKAAKYGCHLLEPLSGDLPANQDVRVKLRSDGLTRILINSEVSKSSDGNFDVTFKTSSAGSDITIYGSSSDDGRLDGLYKFSVV